MTVTEHGTEDFAYGAHYLGVTRSDDVVFIQATASDTRTVGQKKTLYRQIVANLVQSPGVRPEDVFISLVEVKSENWSFGHGLSQYTDPAA